MGMLMMNDRISASWYLTTVEKLLWDFWFSDHRITRFCRHPIVDPASNFDNLTWNQQP